MEMQKVACLPLLDFNLALHRAARRTARSTDPVKKRYAKVNEFLRLSDSDEDEGQLAVWLKLKERLK
jgi:hypothetical protein